MTALFLENKGTAIGNVPLNQFHNMRSAAHQEAVIQLLQHSDAGCGVDSEMVRQASEDRDYWCAVLERITETIRYPSERGYHNEIVGLPKNGRYLGTLELIASKSLATVKRMSDTRWSAHADATEALVKGYDEINPALEEMHTEDEKQEATHEAGVLASDMDRLEIGVLAALWH